MSDGAIRREATRSSTLDPGKLFLGLTLILVGVLFLADQMGYVYAADLIDYWPVLLVALGISQLLRPETDFGGLTVITLGSLLLLDRLDYYPIWQTWPLLIVAVGVSIVLCSVVRKNRRSGQRENDNV